MKNKNIFGLAVLVILSIFTVGALGAQDLKFDGYFNSGIGVLADDDDNSDATAKIYGADSEQNGYRFRLHGTYQNEDKNAGFRFRIQSQGGTNNGGYLSLPYVHGWVRFANDIFYAAAGILQDSTWVTGDWWLNSEFIDWGLGAQLKATPVTGLDLGVGAYTISPQGGGSNNILGAAATAAGVGFGSVTPALENLKYTFSGSYTQKDVFRIAATFRTKNKAGLNGDTERDATGVQIGNYGSSSDYDYLYNGREESSRLFADIRILAVQGLTAVVAASLDRLEDFTDSGIIALSQTIAYKATDELNLGLNAVQFLFNQEKTTSTDEDVDPILVFDLWGSYAIGKVVPRLDVFYALNTINSDGVWARTRNYGSSAYGTSAAIASNSPYSTIGARPSVRFNLDGRAFVEIGDFLNYRLHKDNEDLNKLTNAFYVDFRWTF